ncbi:hypothetical protein [Promicromonospora panici]|uniref:hypothetical protein n=1 Tax=Promicromonospora panici TaxID=2219658 RepID=UPI00101BFAF7|nr:hypothetical protein [Promicromonospora panici]
MTRLKLSSEWWGSDDPEPSAEESFAAVLHEIEQELNPEHDLYGQVVRVEARFWPSDDVIVSLVDGTFALVHPTWSGKVETLPCPDAIRLGDEAAASQAITLWESNR